MKKDIFRTVRELLENRDCVLMGNAVNTEGSLYADSVENLTALLDLEPHIRELVHLCVKVNAQWDALHKIIELIGEPS